MSLIDKPQFLNRDIPFIVSNYIREYDMVKSNISILLRLGIIDQNQFDHYASLPKLDRQIAIGLLQKDEKISNSIRDEMKRIRNQFIYENNLDESKVLSIKNDAFFLIDCIPNQTKFGNIEFALKNTYTSYYFLKGIELYYSYEQRTGNEVLDIKGISDYKKQLHQEYFIDFLKTLFCSAEVETVEETIDLLTSFYEMYIHKKLETNFYREFNNISQIRLNVMGKSFYADHLSETDKIFVDKSYNLNILRDLSSYYTSILHRKMR